MGRLICLFVAAAWKTKLSALVAVFLVGVYFIRHICRVDGGFCEVLRCLALACCRLAKHLVLQVLDVQVIPLV